VLEFSSIEAAQRWLDAHRPLPRAHGSIYGASVERCVRDLYQAKTFTQLKMAARRLSSALAYHHPQMFEPRGQRPHAA